MKKATIFFLSVTISLAIMAQSGDELFVNSKIDSLRHQLSTSGNDSLRANLMVQLAESFMYTNMDSNLYYSEAVLKLAEQTGFIQEQIGAMGFKAQGLINIGNLPKAMEISLKAVEMGKHLPARFGSIGPNYDNLGQIYFLIGEYDQAKKYWRQELAIGEEDLMADAFGNWNIANIYEEINQLDSSLIYLDRSFETFGRIHYSWYPDVYHVFPHWYNTRAKILAKQGKTALALQDFHQSLNMSLKNNELVLSSVTCNDLSNFFDSRGQPDSSIFYAEKALEFARKSSFKKGILDAASLLSKLYEPTTPAKALQYLKIKEEQQNSLFGAGNMEAIREMMAQEEMRQKELAAAQKAYQDRLRQYALLGFLGTALLVAFFLYRNNRQNKKNNARLQAQNRELEIEAALERVRARTMAMQNTEELSGVASVVYHEFHRLGITNFLSTGFHIVKEDEYQLEAWNYDEEQSQIERFNIPLLGDPILEARFEAWKRQEAIYHQSYGGQKLHDHMEFLWPETISSPDVNRAKKVIPDPVHFYFGNFSKGYLHLMTDRELPKDQSLILARFAKVFEQTYTRFLDLKKAEAFARETARQAALDRVRAEIASMRTTEDLEQIPPLIWKELITLEVPFFRCGVFIINEDAQLCRVFLTTPKGESLAALELPFGSSDLVQMTVQHWRGHTVYTQEWSKAEFLQWMQSLIEQGYVDDPKAYQGNEEAPEHLALHFVPFTQGMLYVGSEEALTGEQLSLVQALADAFSVAYARYEDFNHLEKAKAYLEQTLADLRATQSQLIQQEKLASLGELTAGIAHEIQNPINFVNNFSELSIDLADELKAGMGKLAIPEKDKDYFGELLTDLTQNQQKIHHHGKRAANIVTGMLQHARSGTGAKAPTDLNALADEYLRLTYHGLRAKDPTFSASMETDFDPAVGKVEVVAQDIGRVFLNIINNAFYATQQRKNQEPEGYTPKVTISSERTGSGVVFRICDNGTGIPEEVKEKIFQPFFTTKPTGQGTGLGLSLAYDIIVKGHGGTLEVESEEGTGTTFITRLPAKQPFI